MRLSKEAFLETGETLSLKCAVLNLHPGEDVPEMHWYRGNSTLSLDEARGGVLIETDHLTLTSHLQVGLFDVSTIIVRVVSNSNINSTVAMSHLKIRFQSFKLIVFVWDWKTQA